MAYAILSNATNGAGSRWSLQEVRITETAMRGYEWEARLADDGSDWLSSPAPSNGFWVTLYDDAGASMTSPRLSILQISQDTNGNIVMGGLDWTTWRLSTELNPGEGSTLYRSDLTMTISSACTAICNDCDVTCVQHNVAGSMYGIGTISGTALSTLDRVLGLFNYEWIVDTSDRLQVYPLLWDTASSTKSLPTLTARRTRDFDQRKTQMTFSKFLSLDTASAGTRVTVENESAKVAIHTFNTNSNGVKLITGSYTDTVYCGACSLGGNYAKVEVLDWFVSSGWKLELYEGWPGASDIQLDSNCTLLDNVFGEGDQQRPSGSSHYTHARFCKTFWYKEKDDIAHNALMAREFPTVGGMQAVLQCYTEADLEADTTTPDAFNYVYETNRTPSNPDTNVVSDTLWVSQAQCQSLAPGQMWANNRSSHCVEYSGPWILGIHVRDCISHPVYPTARVDQVTYSMSGGTANVHLQCAVLGGNQW